MFVRRWLARLAGARPDVLAQTPVDYFRYTATGGILLTTSAVAAVSASFALHTAVHVGLTASIIAGLAWGVVILNLDRLLIISMTRRSGWWRNIFSALPRLALAILIGTVISVPLVLRIFQPEIEAQLHLQHDQRISEYKDSQGINKSIADLERQLPPIQADANRNPEIAVPEDPGVKAAQQRANTARTTYEDAQREAQCEIDGTCGTGIPGVARAARERQRARDIALGEYDDARAALDAAKTLARDAAVKRATDARQEADRIQRELTDLRATKDAERATFVVKEQNDNGLLARLEALTALGTSRPDLGAAQLVLLLLFMSLEILPVLIKLLQLGGPPTLYEELITKMEEAAKRSAAKATAREENIADDYAERQIDLEHEQARLQFESGLRANELLVTHQSAIAEQAILKWAAEAERRSTQELSNWFHRNNDTRPVDGATVPIFPGDAPRSPTS